MATFLLLHSPDAWPITAADKADFDRHVARLIAGRESVERWSTGVRTGGIEPGDRAFLLRTGDDAGIVSAGTVVSDVRFEPHWDGSPRDQPYVDVRWDSWSSVGLSRHQLDQRLPAGAWRPRASGTTIAEDVADGLEALWAEHLGGVVEVDLAEETTPTDAERNRAVELRAMGVVAAHLRDEGWAVENTSDRHPYDFVAVRDEQELRVEVKGTTNPFPERVLVTWREVESARSSLSALAVVSAIRLESVRGDWIASGGALDWRQPWMPEAPELQATVYRYSLQPRERP